MCRCIEQKLPSMRDGETLGRNKNIIYTDKHFSSLTTSVYDMVSETEARQRMLKVLKKTDLKYDDKQMFIDRVLFNITFEQLAKEYGFKTKEAVFMRLKRIKEYLAEVIKF